MAIQTPTTATRMSEAEYREFALGDAGGQWELVRGHLREKPGMSVEHGDVLLDFATSLRNQLDRSEFRVRAQHARLKRSTETYYVPDVAVIPTRLVLGLKERRRSLEAYPEPLPLVAEIWSPSTGRYDIYRKLPDYQARGDLEIWYIDPYERTVTVWRRQPDGTYSERLYRGGTVRPEALPGVVIDLDELFVP